MPRRQQPRIPLWQSIATLGALAGLAVLLARPAGGRNSVHAVSQDNPFGEAKADDEPPTLQQMRARQTGRGRGAQSPLEIPMRGWQDIFWRSYDQFGRDRLLAVAAGVVFYGLLAIFPAIAALVSSYGLFADAATIGGHLAFAAALMPAGAFEIVQEQINRIAGQGGGGLSAAFVIGLLIAVWSANAGLKAMIDALNVIYDEDEKRSFLKLNAISLLLTLGAFAILLVAIASVIVFPLALNWIGLGSYAGWMIAVLRWPALMVVLTLALMALYRFGPSRKPARWRWLVIGALLATLLWIAGSALFSFYLSRFADYNATYGSLGAGIGLMMWLWLTAISVLVGAELNSEIEHQTAQDSTIGRDKPLGRRQAVMADTVGKAQ